MKTYRLTWERCFQGTLTDNKKTPTTIMSEICSGPPWVTPTEVECFTLKTLGVGRNIKTFVYLTCNSTILGRTLNEDWCTSFGTHQKYHIPLLRMNLNNQEKYMFSCPVDVGHKIRVSFM